MSTWRCLYYALVCCLGSNTFKWPVGGIYSLPHTSSRWTKINIFLSTGALDSPMHNGHALFIVRCRATSANRWSLQQSTVGSDHCQTVWCTPDSPVLQPERAYLQALLRRLSGCLTGQFGAHRTGYCSLSGAPRGCWLTAHFMDFFADSLGFFCS
jgi:hypothetical protein